MDQRTKEPSIFLGALAGYALASMLGVVATVVLSINSGRASATGGLKLLTPVGALGAYLGYVLAVKRRKALGISGPHDEWSKFFGSGTFFVVALIVIAGSFGLAVLIKVVFDALVGHGG
jgi:hypothetical protein